MQEDARLGQGMVEILLQGVSTRSYEKVLPEMADAVGVSKSAVSTKFIQASTTPKHSSNFASADLTRWTFWSSTWTAWCSANTIC
jgi:hypothetical protein